MTTYTTTARERRARKHLKKLGYTLKKTPPRHWTRKEHGVGYMITGVNTIFAGYDCDIDEPGFVRDYTLTIEAVEGFIANRAAHEVREDLANVLHAYAGFGGDRFLEVAAAMVRRAA